jgi:hypothetical protein
MGHYQPLQGQDSCISCSKGTYCDTLGCNSCNDCDAGEEALTEGQEKCSLCKKGYYKSKKSSSNCVQCDAGFYTLDTGSKTCLLCPGGFYCKCSYCQPQECPKGSVCPPGSSSFITCSSPFYYAKDSIACKKSLQFYVLIVGSILAFLTLLTIGIVTYYKKKKFLQRGIESTKLIFSKKDPVYDGY